ncbi:hypothetical protein TruAng_000393 [Truncatella angustata]|nr:hypothetical protein TruAng_000393 [Truncatella angustata]
MDACNGFFFGDNPDSPRGLYFLSEVLCLVNERLRGKEALSDSTLSLVISLILQEEMRHDQAGAEIHYAGLTKMVQLRGGLNEFNSNLPLLLKICKMDICHALQNGGPVLFFWDCLPSSQTDVHHVLSSSSYLDGDMAPDLRRILVDALNFSAQVNQCLNFPAYDVITFQETLVSICCRLNQFQPLKALRCGTPMESAYHIGLTTFMMTLFMQWDGRRIWHYPLVSRHLREVLEYEEMYGCGEYDNLLLWVMFIGGIWVLADPDGFWLLPKLRTLVRKLGIKDFEGVLKRLRSFPWINEMHDEAGRFIMDML